MLITLGSDQYQRIKYPAGELQVRLTEQTTSAVQSASEVRVLARISSADQIVELCLLWDAVKSTVSAGARTFLILPYLPFSRADRRFLQGDCFGLKVFSDILRTLDATVVTIDAHSGRAQQLIPSLIDVSPMPLMVDAIKHFAAAHKCDRVTLLYPDEGARKRYQLPAAVGGVTTHALHCAKKRDSITGKFTGFTVPAVSEFPQSSGRPYPSLIIDDICDGGGTFNGIADALKDYAIPLGLYVTHGIFSKGLTSLESRFTAIYTTDTFRDWQPSEKLQIFSALPLLLGANVVEPVAPIRL